MPAFQSVLKIAIVLVIKVSVTLSKMFVLVSCINIITISAIYFHLKKTSIRCKLLVSFTKISFLKIIKLVNSIIVNCFLNFITILSECVNNTDCTAVENKNTCNKNACACNGGYIPDQDTCKPCAENEISVQNQEDLTFSCLACPEGEIQAEDGQHCVGRLKYII